MVKENVYLTDELFIVRITNLNKLTMTQRKAPTGEPQEGSEALAKQLKSASPEAIRAALEGLNAEQPGVIADAIFAVSESARKAAASIIVSVSGADRPDELEQAPEERISFADAAEAVGNRIISVGGVECVGLAQALEQTVKDRERWAYIKALIQAGKIKSTDQYGAALQDRATFDWADLQRIVAEAKQNRLRDMLIFDAGLLLPHEDWDELFAQKGIPYWQGSYGFNNLAQIRRVKPADFEAAGFALNDLHNQSWERQMEAFKRAYGKASPLQPAGARVLFTPDTAEVTRTGISATRDMQALATEGHRTVDIGANLIRFRTQIDAGLRKIAASQGVDFEALSPEDYQRFMATCFGSEIIDKYMPDRVNITRNSDCVYPNGGVADLYWDPVAREVCLYYSFPDHANGRLGSRRARG